MPLSLSCAVSLQDVLRNRFVRGFVGTQLRIDVDQLMERLQTYGECGCALAHTCRCECASVGVPACLCVHVYTSVSVKVCVCLHVYESLCMGALTGRCVYSCMQVQVCKSECLCASTREYTNLYGCVGARA